MKILVISLLRIGDLMMHVSLLKRLSIDFEGAEIHLCVNDICQEYAYFLKQEHSFIKKIFIFERQQIQRQLVGENHSPMRAYEKTKELISDLNNEFYQKAYNFTHTTFSARFMDLIQASEKKGVFFNNGKRSSFSNWWIRYFNDRFSESSNSNFHYIEALAKSLDIHGQIGDKNGSLLNGSRIDVNHKIICLQPLSSDPKKNWSLLKYNDLIKNLLLTFKDYTLYILGSPSEENFLNENFDDYVNTENINNYKIKIKCCSWDELKQIFSRTDLLITCDTSVQHFAVQYRVPTLSLFFGSANPKKTAPYQDNAKIISSSVPCFPCKHSEPCSEKRYLCQDSVSVEDVMNIIKKIIPKNNSDLDNHVDVSASVNAEVSSELKLFEVIKNKSDRFFLKENRKELENSIALIQQMVWQIYLDKLHLEMIPPYGSCAWLLIQDFNQTQKSILINDFILTRISRNESDRLFLDEIESRILSTVKNYSANNCFIKDRSVLNYMDFQNTKKDSLDFIQVYLKFRSNENEYLYQLKFALKEEGEIFQDLRRIKMAIGEARDLLSIEIKLLKTIYYEIKESINIEEGVGNVTRARKLSEACSSAT